MSLERLLVLYEPEAACRDRLVVRGFAAEIAAEIAFYLAQATDFAAMEPAIRTRLGEAGIGLVTAPLDAVDGWLPELRRPGTLVWALTDGFAYFRGSFVSSLAGLLDVPQFGSPPAAQHLCQDKFRSGAVVRAAGMTTPATALARDGKLLSPPPPDGTLFVKPNTLGAKLGIEADSRVASLDEALALSRRIWARYRDAVVIQPYVEGRDVRVSFLDPGDGRALPGLYAVRTAERGFPTLADSLRITRLRAADGDAVRLERIDAPQLEAAALHAADILGLRDVWSMDFRLAPDGTPWFLEFEVCPAVTIYDFLTYLDDAYGLDLGAALALAAPAAYARRREGSS